MQLSSPILDKQLLNNKECLASAKVGDSINIGGWVRSVREVGNVVFVSISDGSQAGVVQLLMSRPFFGTYCKEAGVGVGSSIVVSGKVVDSKGSEQAIEIHVTECLYIGSVGAESYPMQKKSHSLEFMRKHMQFRPRTKLYGAINRIRNRLFMAIHCELQRQHFLFVPTPILTTNDCEGGGDMLEVSHPKDNLYFGSPVFLTVSGQLHLEPYACAHSRVYSFGPTFRGEKSQTGRHLSEFWMLEPELAFVDIDGLIEFVSKFWVTILNDVVRSSESDYQDIEDILGNEFREMISLWVQEPDVISYHTAVNILNSSNQEFVYEVDNLSGLQTEHERFLTDVVYKKPLIVRDYPRKCKAFYMKVNPGGETVSSFDLLAPGVGEIIGGSQREELYDVLLESMSLHNVDASLYTWYVDLRKHGSVIHSGFGLGFERLLKGLVGIDNIKDVVPYARSYKDVMF